MLTFIFNFEYHDVEESIFQVAVFHAKVNAMSVKYEVHLLKAQAKENFLRAVQAVLSEEAEQGVQALCSAIREVYWVQLMPTSKPKNFERSWLVSVARNFAHWYQNQSSNAS
jgi:hypothetical protein